MFLCPSNLQIVSIATPCDSVMVVAKVCRAQCVVGVEIVAAMFLRGAEPVEKFGLLGIGETLAVEVACDQVVDMSVLHVHLFYSRISGPNPYLPG